jgi:hypothetical protein
MLLVLGCAGKTKPAGGLEIIIATDMPTPESFDQVRVNVLQQAADGGWIAPALLDKSYAIPTETVLPTTISIAGGQTPYRTVQITVTGAKAGAPPLPPQSVVERVVQTQVPIERVGELIVWLRGTCKLTCPVGDPQTCVAAGAPNVCGPDIADAASLPPYTPGDVTQAGVASLDAAVSSSTDSSDAEDASMTDSATVDSSVGDGAGDAPACADVCTEGQTRCSSIATVDSCQVQPSGCTQWVTTACGVHQSCAAAAGSGMCTCRASECTQVGTLCQDVQTLASCMKDAEGCLYIASTSTCAAPKSCSGMAPGAVCSLTCTDSCKQGQSSCVAGALATCALRSNGCRSYGGAVPCGLHQTCTGLAGAAKCTCNVDIHCTPAPACISTTALATCSKDMQNCAYSSGMMTCTNGACSAGACCTNACINGATRCGGRAVQVCGNQVNSCTGWSSTPCTTGEVCERYAGPVCLDENWAEWPMPNSAPDVVAGAPNPEAYTNNGDGTVTDNVTGLIWQSPGPTLTYSQAGAIAYCGGLNLGGFTDWRVPAIIELFSLVDLSAAAPTINSTYFPGTVAGIYWSSTPSAGPVGNAWTVTFMVGLMSPNQAVTSLGSVRCVR